ncbi:MAG: CDP-archaeol synthase [Clostridia bacterium]|nr:CDP-archaeol synthase [Clostridia bacterium]
MVDKNINTPANVLKRIIFGAGILFVVVGFFLLRQISDNTVYLFDILVGFLMISGSFEIDNLLKKLNRYAYSIVLGIYPILCFLLLILCINFNISCLLFLAFNILLLVAIFGFCYLYSLCFKRSTLKFMYYVGYEKSRYKFCLEVSLNTILGLIYPTFLMIFIFLINHFSSFNPNINTNTIGFLGLVLLFSTTMVADTCAFIVGRLIKSKKICLKKLGPGKSWSGLCGGILGAIIASIIVYVIFVNCGYAEIFGDFSINFWSFLFAGLFCGMFNMAGDIFASYLKRRAGIKDFSNLIPGHGGIMDRVNGLIFNAPVVFVVLLIMF